MNAWSICGLLAAALLCDGRAFAEAAAPAAPTNEWVVLVHGLARSSRSMRPMQRRLEQEGYRVSVVAYPSTKFEIGKLTDDYLRPEIDRCRAAGARRIDFVAHSLGAILVRQYLADQPLPELGRIVMLGPPNEGSEVVDKLGDWKAFRWINGPAGEQLGTGTNSVPNRLPAPTGEVAVVAGTASINWILSALIPGPDDGKVSVVRAKLPWMKDFAAVPVAHPFLMKNRRVIDMVAAFLKTGYFEPRTPAVRGSK